MPAIEEIYRRYLACCNDRRFDELGEFVHDPLLANGEEISLADYKRRLSSNIEAAPDFRWKLQDIVANDRKLAVRIAVTGTPIAEWRGFAPTGRSIDVSEHAFYHFADGKIAEVWFLFDTRSITSQLK